MDTVTLSNGIVMPQLGFGVFQIPADQTKKAVLDAISCGYRLIDTAQSYMNEREVGQAVAECGLDRSELFITTKVWIANYGYDACRASVLHSLDIMNLEYLDLVLLHQPFADYYGAWRALEDLYKEGKIRAIGVSNFPPDRLADLQAFNEISPMINQVEVNPFCQNVAAQKEMIKRHVQIEAWAPFGEGRKDMFTNPVLVTIAQEHSKSVAQVILRWLMQRDVVAVCKSVHKERMAQNLDIFDFSLTEQDMEQIAALNVKNSLFFDHQSPETVDFMKGLIEQRKGKIQ